MQIQQDDKADAGPHIKDEVGTSTDADEFRNPRGMRRKPDEVETREAHDTRQNRHDRGASILRPGVEEDDSEQERKHDLGDHR